MDGKKKSVLMVCMGNTCRSPIAQAVFQDIIEKRGVSHKWFVDSAATHGFHTGKNPNFKGQEILKTHGISTSHKARTLNQEDFFRFDYILGMDNYNVQDIKSLKPSKSKAVIELFSKYDPSDSSTIRDPYCDRGYEGFELAYERSVRIVNQFLDTH